MELKEKIQILRKDKNLSQEKLADMLNISRQAVQKWEIGETFPDIENLVSLSKIFGVSLDKLLKDEECVNFDKSEEYAQDDIRKFLIEAKKNTYAGNANEEKISSRPGSHDLKYKQGDYEYFDTYLGGNRFIGEEAVFYKNQPIWAMNYKGIEINDKFSGSFLKEALSNIDPNRPYRGMEIYKEGNYTYVCSVEGTFEDFHGEEIMYCENEKVYTCNFCGGIVK
jgi:transcriptional regulator with XRE-family HTH domain